MKIALKSEERFTVVGPSGLPFSNLRKVGPEWNGLTEFRTQAGEVIIAAPDGGVVSRLSDSLLSQTPGIENWTVVSGSPDLISQLCGAPKAAL